MSPRGGLIILFLIACLHGGAQPFFRQQLDSVHMLIGQQACLTWQSTVKPSGPDPFEELKKQGWMEIIDPGQWNLTPDRIHERKIRFSVFDSGQYVIPPAELLTDSLRLSAPPLYLRVDLPVDTAAALIPIRDIIATAEAGHRWIFLAIALVLAALVLGLLYFLFRADRVRPGKIEYSAPARPHEVALQRLEELEQRKLWQSGRIKEYYDEWLNILRGFLQEGFGLPAPESTTAEIVRRMEASGVAWQKKDELVRWLKNGDLIRFANKEAVATDHIDAMAAARSFVSSNRDNALEFLEQHRMDYRSLLGEAGASQFEFPDRTVPEELVQLAGNKTTAALILYSGLTGARRFQLPEQWVALHQSRMGRISSWHAGLMNSRPGWPGVLMLLLLTPVLAVFLPVLALTGWLRKENIFSRGVFVLGGSDKLIVDEKKLGS